jgi:hypothetical protein
MMGAKEGEGDGYEGPHGEEARRMAGSSLALGSISLVSPVRRTVPCNVRAQAARR